LVANLLIPRSFAVQLRFGIFAICRRGNTMSDQDRALRRRGFRKLTAVFAMLAAFALAPLAAMGLLLAMGAG
jgi:hypothetical protein